MLEYIGEPLLTLLSIGRTYLAESLVIHQGALSVDAVHSILRRLPQPPVYVPTLTRNIIRLTLDEQTICRYT